MEALYIFRLIESLREMFVQLILPHPPGPLLLKSEGGASPLALRERGYRGEVSGRSNKTYPILLIKAQYDPSVSGHFSGLEALESMRNPGVYRSSMSSHSPPESVMKA